MRNRLI
jgi:hypothetical protein